MRMRLTGAASWRADKFEGKAAAALLPPRVRSRSSVLTCALAEVYQLSLERAGAKPGVGATVFASAYGETGVLLPLLYQAITPGEDMSPLRFSSSVHNAASARITIATADRGFTTSIAAGEETVAAAMVEAYGLLCAGWGTVVVVIGDEQPPDLLTRPALRFLGLAAAFHLVASDSHVAVPSSWLELMRQPTETGGFAATNACESAVRLAEMVLDGCSGEIALARGRWVLRLESAPPE